MKKLAAIAGLVTIVVLGYWMLSGEEGEAGRTVYETKEVAKGTISRQVSASGAVDAVTMVEISTEVSGLISELHVDFNSPVKAGTLLAVINPQTFSSRLRQREAELKVAEASVTVREAEIGSNEATVAKAERDYGRVRQLRESGNVSEAALDEAATRLETSRRSLAMGKAQLLNALANVDMRKAALEQAEIDLAKTSVRSPIDGIVIERSIEIGQTVAASFSAPKLFRIAEDLNEIEIEASIDEADIGNIKEGNKVTFTVDAHPDRKFEGTVAQVRLAPTIEQNVVTYTVVIHARNRGQLLLPGMTANVDIITGERTDVLRVSNNALRFKPRGENTEAESQGGNPGDMAERAIVRLKEQLELSEEQTAKVSDALKPIYEDMMKQFQAASSGGGTDRRAMMQRFRTIQARALEPILTPEQMSSYRKATESRGNRRSGGRPGQVWIMTADGRLESRRVRLGISDDQYTEVTGGQLNPGDKVVTGARVIKDED